MRTVENLEQGREAFDQRAWPEAYERLAQADGGNALEPDDLERLASAAYLTGHDAASTDAWTRAHLAWLDTGDPRRAVRSAFWLGFGLVQRGEMPRGAAGWPAPIGWSPSTSWTRWSVATCWCRPR